MLKLTIVFGFRDRELSRVERCLDSLKNQSVDDFEVIFIDYGSKEPKALQVEKLVNTYSFCRYVYNDTRGWLWNRSHALNTGIRLAKSEYVMTSDIDLVFSIDFVATVMKELSPALEIHSSAFALPRNFRQWKKLNKGEGLRFKKRSSTALGLVQIVLKQKLEEIRGFDEFYRIWGAEDEDLNYRLTGIGIKTYWLDLDLNPVFHQWHPNAGLKSRARLPESWQIFIGNYLHANKNRIRRNEDWGELFSLSKNRPALKLAIDESSKHSLELDFNKDPVHINILRLQNNFNQLETNATVRITFANAYNENYRKARLNRFIGAMNKYLMKLSISFMFINEQEYFRYRTSTYDLKDNLIYFLIVNRSKIQDYHLSFDNEELTLILVKA